MTTGTHFFALHSSEASAGSIVVILSSVAGLSFRADFVSVRVARHIWKLWFDLRISDCRGWSTKVNRLTGASLRVKSHGSNAHKVTLTLTSLLVDQKVLVWTIINGQRTDRLGRFRRLDKLVFWHPGIALIVVTIWFPQDLIVRFGISTGAILSGIEGTSVRARSKHLAIVLDKTLAAIHVIFVSLWASFVSLLLVQAPEADGDSRLIRPTHLEIIDDGLVDALATVPRVHVLPRWAHHHALNHTETHARFFIPLVTRWALFFLTPHFLARCVTRILSSDNGIIRDSRDWLWLLAVFIVIVGEQGVDLISMGAFAFVPWVCNL